MALVCMPFGPVFAPSLGLSLLRAGLAEHHLDSRVHYFSIRFAESIGQAFYTDISTEGRPALEDLAGEWLFNRALFGDAGSAGDRYVDEILRGYYSDALIARLLRARTRVDGFLDECLDVLLRQRPKIVGFTSTFQQHVPSLALARRVKEASPSTFVIFGGANCEGVMGAETVRSFPFVDAAFSGEADLVFPELVRRVLDGGVVSELPGVRSRTSLDAESAAGVFENGPMVCDMDRLPLPDYTDYFEQFAASRYRRDWQPTVFVETSRGCWWGERMHCTFCGLNGSTLHFRSKSPARAVSEITTLMRRHPGCDVEAVDNILDMRYLDEVIPALARRRRRGAALFYETKANLKKEQLRRLRRAGVAIQPGIESFSDPVLKLMRKGVTGLQNIQLLKWCKELGVRATWNFLWGFPGEPPGEYDRLARLVPLLTHLPPPVVGAPMRLDRFSPNFVNAAHAGFTDVAPLPAYAHVYRLTSPAVANLACHFTFRPADGRDVRAYTQGLAREVEAWRRARSASELVASDTGEHLIIVDLRPVSRTPFTVLSGLARALYRECDAVRDVSHLVRTAEAWTTAPCTRDLVERALASLVERGLMVRDGSRCLALAIPLGEYAPPAAANRAFAALVRRVGQWDRGKWMVPVDVLRGVRVGTARPRGGAARVPRLDAAGWSIRNSGELVIERAEGTGPR